MCYTRVINLMYVQIVSTLNKGFAKKYPYSPTPFCRKGVFYVSCYHPNRRFSLGKNPATGKTIGRITPFNCHHVEKLKNGTYENSFNDFISSRAVKAFFCSVPVPCGQCHGCRLDKSRMWADRCMLEAKYHEHNYFLTLTYNDKYLPLSKDTGFPTLAPADFDHFRMRLRTAYYKKLLKSDPDHARIRAEELKYFMCGEYGDQTKRPHYHAIYFGLELDDLKFYSERNGMKYYTSQWLQDRWSEYIQPNKGETTGFYDPLGYVVIGEANWQSAAYVSRYVMKKSIGGDYFSYSEHGMVNQYQRQSKGISKQYFEDHKNEIYATDKIFLSSQDGSIFMKPPHYYDYLYDLEAHEDLQEIKSNRRLRADLLKCQTESRTDLDYLDYLKVAERAKIRQTSGLVRPLD